ncbi:DUF4097 domain-containing protein [Sporosarcina aquimarina]|uniref:DUF4097 family beta strand repeat-containing protein n=1 Tax=Sporosarcina aquimarina TaxID=114975 RepID=UPI00203DA13D|nr:DUF4097 family beta strand repeat-containing protein [Sporosarcina aquimarina]MCM3755870.1 DUF4097 domain-containing protein [Sporosarcina aquimarina]
MNISFKKVIGSIFACTLIVILAACSSDSEVSYEKKTYSAEASKVQQISLSTKGRSVELEASKDDEIHITYFESDKESYNVDLQDNGDLVMQLVTDKDWKDYVGLKTDKEHHLVKIAVPNGISSAITIETSNEDIILSDLKINGLVEAKTNEGKIEASNITANKNITMKTKNDDIILNEVITEGSIEATTNKGGAKVSNVSVGNTLKLRTKDGDITGTVKGSYDMFEIISEVSKGDNNLPETKKGGDKTLDVGANNGDINLEFVE